MEKLEDDVFNIINNNKFNINNISQEVKLQLFNTLSKQKEEFIPIDKNEITIYSCGPTVYNYAHIWNLRSYIFPDILKNVLQYVGYKNIKHVINFTDVWHLTDDASDWDDKMELSAKKQWKDIWEIANYYSEAFKNDIKALNIEFPNLFTPATKYIPEQIEAIETLEKKWYTYKTDDWIYFNTKKFWKYWDFANIVYEWLEGWKRVEIWWKLNNTDFALWKFSPIDKTRQMEWESPWGVWFPGWHIECSCMAMSELWNTIDIHTWWTDHIHVHHTNEIAQSECISWEKFVNYWLHGEFLVLGENERMWKSKWNFIKLQDIIDKWISPMAYRYLVLTAHYRSFLNFSFDILDFANDSYLKLKKNIQKLSNINNSSIYGTEEAIVFYDKIIKALLDDLNTPQTIWYIWKLLKYNNISSKVKLDIIKNIDNILSLKLFDFSDLNYNLLDIPEAIFELAEKRKIFREKKNYIDSDIVRDKINKKGYDIQDIDDDYKIIKL